MGEKFPGFQGIMETYKTRMINIKWKGNENADDCAIYTMRHMETYRGQKAADWDCGFTQNDVSYALENNGVWKLLKSKT